MVKLLAQVQIPLQLNTKERLVTESIDQVSNMEFRIDIGFNKPLGKRDQILTVLANTATSDGLLHILNHLRLRNLFTQGKHGFTNYNMTCIGNTIQFLE